MFRTAIGWACVGQRCPHPPRPRRGCSSSASSELVSVDLPAGALVIGDRRFTVVLDRAEPSTGAGDCDGGNAAWVSLVERGEGTDHVLGGDRP